MNFKPAFKHIITLEPTINGGILASCGCARLVFDSPKKCLAGLKEYFADPEAIEKEYFEAQRQYRPLAEVPAGGRIMGSGRTRRPENIDDAPDQERSANDAQEEARERGPNES